MRQLWMAGAIAIGAIAPAHADRVGVIAVTATASDRSAVASAIGRAVSPGPASGDVVSAADAIAEARAAIIAGAVPAVTLERFRRVREQIDEGWRAFVRVQVELAASRLSVARTEAESLVAYPGGDVLYADAALRLGAVLGHQGRAAESLAALSLALALDPDRPISLAEFSPDVVAAVEAVRAQTRPTRQVRITSDPAGAAITVDGKALGRAPLEATLAVGQHVMVAQHALYEPRAIAVAVEPVTEELSLELSRDTAWSRLAEGASIGLDESTSQQLVDATLQFADLDSVIVVISTQRRGGPALLVQRCAGVPARCTAVVELGYNDAVGLPSAAREAWQTVRAADLRYPPGVFADARATGTPIDDRCTSCRSPILWGGIGAAAVIATVVVIAIVSGSSPPPTVAVDPAEF